jgi:hypothetical protein
LQAGHRRLYTAGPLEDSKQRLRDKKSSPDNFPQMADTQEIEVETTTG